MPFVVTTNGGGPSVGDRQVTNRAMDHVQTMALIFDGNDGKWPGHGGRAAPNRRCSPQQGLHRAALDVARRRHRVDRRRCRAAAVFATPDVLSIVLLV